MRKQLTIFLDEFDVSSNTLEQVGSLKSNDTTTVILELAAPKIAITAATLQAALSEAVSFAEKNGPSALVQQDQSSPSLTDDDIPF